MSRVAGESDGRKKRAGQRGEISRFSLISCFAVQRKHILVWAIYSILKEINRRIIFPGRNVEERSNESRLHRGEHAHWQDRSCVGDIYRRSVANFIPFSEELRSSSTPTPDRTILHWTQGNGFWRRSMTLMCSTRWAGGAPWSIGNCLRGVNI